MSQTRLNVGWVFVGCSLLTHILIVWTYANQPASLAAFTVYPIWFWGSTGLSLSVIAFCLLRAPLSLLVTAVWVATLLLSMDEAKVLTNFNHPKLVPERRVLFSGSRLIRVATVNCASFSFGDPLEELKKWEPDIVLLQDVGQRRVDQMADALYGEYGDFRAYKSNVLLTRFEIRRALQNPHIRSQQVTIRLPEGSEIEVVNIHLSSAATDMRLWSDKSKNIHRENHEVRNKELSSILRVLKKTAMIDGTPAIVGGDFNSSATDVVHRQLARDFDNSFAKAGRGWGNTFHRRFPILRIDHIYATRQFDPISSRVVVTKSTDHRMVISDLLLRQ